MKSVILCLIAISLPFVLGNLVNLRQYQDRILDYNGRRNLHKLNLKIDKAVKGGSRFAKFNLDIVSDDSESKEVTDEEPVKPMDDDIKPPEDEEKSDVADEAISTLSLPTKSIDYDVSEDGPTQKDVPWPLNKAPTIFVVLYETLKVKNKANKSVYIPNIEADNVLDLLKTKDSESKE